MTPAEEVMYLTGQLDALAEAGFGESERYEKLCEQCADLWYKLTPSEEQFVRQWMKDHPQKDPLPPTA